jgi:hypothetical protein
VSATDAAREDCLAGKVTQCGNVESVRGGGWFDLVRGGLRFSGHQRGF